MRGPVLRFPGTGCDRCAGCLPRYGHVAGGNVSFPERQRGPARTEAAPVHLAGYIRGHSTIENKVHWVRDVTCREDSSRGHPDPDAKLNRTAWETASGKYVREYDDLLQLARDQSSLARCEPDILRPLLRPSPVVVHLQTAMVSTTSAWPRQALIPWSVSTSARYGCQTTCWLSRDNG